MTSHTVAAITLNNMIVSLAERDCYDAASRLVDTALKAHRVGRDETPAPLHQENKQELFSDEVRDRIHEASLILSCSSQLWSCSSPQWDSKEHNTSRNLSTYQPQHASSLRARSIEVVDQYGNAVGFQFTSSLESEAPELVRFIYFRCVGVMVLDESQQDLLLACLIHNHGALSLCRSRVVDNNNNNMNDTTSTNHNDACLDLRRKGYQLIDLARSLGTNHTQSTAFS